MKIVPLAAFDGGACVSFVWLGRVSSGLGTGGWTRLDKVESWARKSLVSFLVNMESTPKQLEPVFHRWGHWLA